MTLYKFCTPIVVAIYDSVLLEDVEIKDLVEIYPL